VVQIQQFSVSNQQFSVSRAKETFMERTRSYEWQDPTITAAAAREMSGLELLQAIAEGRLPGPPIASTLDFAATEVAEGRVVFVCTPGEHHYNPIGSVHGGLYATLADSAAACAIHTTLPKGMAYTTLDLSIRLLRPITADTGPIRCVGTVVNRGRRTALAQAELFDPADRLLAHAMSTCLLFEIPATA
jgi:uncharacterized protein (TIGR00369 family)